MLTTTSWTPVSSRNRTLRHVVLAAGCVLTAMLSMQAQSPAGTQSRHARAAQTSVRQASLASLIQRGDRRAALDRIRAGADVNEPQPDGTRPIHWAVYRVDYELLDALIARKAKADVTNEFGDTPLAEAVKVADRRMVKTLLDAGASV